AARHNRYRGPAGHRFRAHARLPRAPATAGAAAPVAAVWDPQTPARGVEVGAVLQQKKSDTYCQPGVLGESSQLPSGIIGTGWAGAARQRAPPTDGHRRGNAGPMNAVTAHDTSGRGFLAGGGEMGEHIRALDWSGTPLGTPESWSVSL